MFRSSKEEVNQVNYISHDVYCFGDTLKDLCIYTTSALHTSTWSSGIKIMFRNFAVFYMPQICYNVTRGFLAC